MIDKEKKDDYRFDVNFKDVSKSCERSEVMNPFDSKYPAVQQFSECGVRIGDAVEYRIPGSNEISRGYISELREDRITVRHYNNGEYESEARLGKSIFDEFELEIFDDNRGCDNSAIGLSGCYEPWRRMWF